MTSHPPASTPPARTLYRGGTVYSPAHPFATAVLVEGDAIAWVGSDEAAAGEGGPGTVVVELDGALVTPAFVDAHVHTTETGLAIDGVDLTATTSLAQALDLVAAATRAGAGRPVLGHGWDELTWPEGRAPTRAELDRASAGGVVYLTRVDVHSAVVSSALAAAAGLRGMDGWDDDGRVEREAHHGARALTRTMPAGRRQEVQRRALRSAAAAGIGCVHEMSAPHVAPREDLAALVALAREEPLPEVVAYWGELVADDEQARDVVAGLGLPEGALRGLAGDLCADGSIGSRTAAFRDDYADAPGSRGHLYLRVEQVRDHIVACTRAGLQAGFHLIGDAAVQEVLAGFDAATTVVGASAVAGGGHRLEHVEAVDAPAIEALARLGVLASVQPAFDAAWGGQAGMYATRLGPTRAPALNPLASLAAAGVPLALGSDSPVTPFDPWGAVRASGFHHVAEQRISVRAAFLAHTRGGRRAAGQPGQGVIAPGAPATLAIWSGPDGSRPDLVVQAPDDRIQTWSTDPRSGTPGLPDVSSGATLPICLRTLVRGRVVHDLQGAC